MVIGYECTPVLTLINDIMAFFKTKQSSGNLVAVKEKVIVTPVAAEDYKNGKVENLIQVELDERWVLIMHVSEGIEMEILVL